MSDVDAAVVAKLSGDTGAGGLMTIMSDGIFMDVAPANKTKFVIVSLVMHEDESMFAGTAYEKSTYLIKAVEKSTSGALAKQAEARIYALMQFQPLAVTGYAHMLTRREERVRYTEVDSVNADIRWQHRGARWAVFVSPNADE